MWGLRRAGRGVTYVGLGPAFKTKFFFFFLELWIDNSGAIGGLLKGYSSIPDCARIINTFHFAIAKLGLASIWIDYVPSESNPADAPSRFHEMSYDDVLTASATLGVKYTANLPELASRDGLWLSFSAIAKSIWA